MNKLSILLYITLICVHLLAVFFPSFPCCFPVHLPCHSHLHMFFLNISILVSFLANCIFCYIPLLTAKYVLHLAALMFCISFYIPTLSFQELLLVQALPTLWPSLSPFSSSYQHPYSPDPGKCSLTNSGKNRSLQQSLVEICRNGSLIYCLFLFWVEVTVT